MIRIEPCTLEDVINFDKTRFNSNNHWENGVQPKDYSDVLQLSSAEYWVDQFKNYNVIKIDLQTPLANWLRSANEIGVHTGYFPKSFEDELDLFCENQSHLDIFDGQPYFVRASNVSLKDGKHGKGPYTNIRQVIESLVTCTSRHTPLSTNRLEILLYVIPWVTIPKYKEFRVFIYQNKINAISQQNLYNVNQLLCDLDTETRHEEIRNWIEIISHNYYTVIQPLITHIDSYCMDFALLDNNECYFIELNSFGKEYASGSSLFHWLNDYDILYGLKRETDGVYFRYTTS